EVVYVLGGRKIQPRWIGGGTLADGIERDQRLLCLRWCENARLFDGTSPGAVNGQLIGQQAAIETKGALKLVEQLVRGLIEPSTPELAGTRGFWPPGHDAESFAGMVTGKAKRLINPSASLGL